MRPELLTTFDILLSFSQVSHDSITFFYSASHQKYSMHTNSRCVWAHVYVYPYHFWFQLQSLICNCDEANRNHCPPLSSILVMHIVCYHLKRQPPLKLHDPNLFCYITLENDGSQHCMCTALLNIPCSICICIIFPQILLLMLNYEFSTQSHNVIWLVEHHVTVLVMKSSVHLLKRFSTKCIPADLDVEYLMNYCPTHLLVSFHQTPLLPCRMWERWWQRWGTVRGCSKCFVSQTLS